MSLRLLASEAHNELATSILLSNDCQRCSYTGGPVPAGCPYHPTTFGGQLWVFARTVVCCLSRRRAKVGGTVRGTNPPCAVMLKTRPHLPSGEQTEFSMLSDG